jgi:DNA-binding response OmpR family regulator
LKQDNPLFSMQFKGKVTVAGKVLVVDDDANIRQVLAYRLGRDGYSVLLSGNGEDALEQARIKQPDLIILDLVLPQLDGFGFLKQLRSEADTNDIPVLVLTAYGHEQNRARSLELGAVAFVVKPFSPRELVADIERVLDAKT